MRVIRKSQVEEAMAYALHLDEDRDFYGRSLYPGYREKDRWAEAEALEAAYNRQWWVRFLKAMRATQ